MNGIRTAPNEIWAEYQAGMQYKRSIGLPDIVRKNRNFYLGKQWEGVRAPDLDKPVFNIMGRVLSYFIALLVSDDVAVSVEPFNALPDGPLDRALRIAASQIEQVIELNNMRLLNRDAIRDMAIDGDMCLHAYFDPNARTGQAAAGMIRAELIDNLNVIFGNPYRRDKEAQRYIILVQPRQVEEIREEARANGAPEGTIAAIVPDRSGDGRNAPQRYDCAVELIKYWRQDDAVWYTKVTRNAVIKPPTNTEYTRYPIAYQSWMPVKNSYHGQAALTELIPNQIMINKLFAMALKAQIETAFPKILYDGTKLERWTNQIGAIRVNGDPTSAVATALKGVELNPSVMSLIDAAIAYTRDLMGASDAALGSVNPDNTSAIIAVQKATAVPLELQRIAFYQFVEDYVRVFLDMICADYGLREVLTTDREGNPRLELFDFSTLRDRVLNVRVDIGAGTYFSEIAQIQTLDNLYDKGVITDPLTYVESIPEGYVKNRNKLIAQLKRRQAAAEALGGGDTPDSSAQRG